MMKTTRRVANGMVVIAATTTVMIGICIAMIVYVLIQLLEAPPQPPQPLLQHPVKTSGKQRNAKRWRRKEDVKNPKLRPIAKRLVEFARRQEYIFFKLYTIK